MENKKRLIDISEYNLKNGLIQWVEYGEHSVSLHSKMLHEIPTVDAEPVVHGRWIPVLNGIDDDTNPAFDCSECDAMCNKKHNYCPVCGAKMDLEEQCENN